MTKSQLRRFVEQAEVFQPMVENEAGEMVPERPDLPDFWRVDASKTEGNFSVDVHAENEEDARQKAYDAMALQATE